jgi:hypothetical protein
VLVWSSELPLISEHQYKFDIRIFQQTLAIPNILTNNTPRDQPTEMNGQTDIPINITLKQDGP